VLPAETAVQAMSWDEAADAPVVVVERVETAPQDEILARERAAFEQGVEHGRAAAGAEISARADAAIARAAAAAAELAAAAPRARAAAQDDIVRLSIAIAQRILRRELAIDAEALAGIVVAALDRLNRREIRRVRVSREDVAAVERNVRAAGVPPGVVVDADPSLERGSLIFETDRGNLDASVWTQLGEIERGLVEGARRGRL
jgi:flagellar biosynthesis/type III secretory pathway protein FliH